ncbi:leucine-rich repeat-containing protein 18-like isoform X3 [Tigriopus californicus]|nr:leucine-rich repeat-containing protein 18-like isoform X3 [Tigriopus californicus]
MVFGHIDDLEGSQEGATRLQALRAANCLKVLGKGVIRVVHRVEEARESCKLDLSNCQLMQVPDAVYYMLRNTPLIECNLAFNVISKIPPKLPAKFSFIKKLNLSHNRLSALPDEIRELTQLEMVDISSNSFLSLPACLFATPKLAEIRAQKNFITDVDADAVSSSPKLEQLNLKENPLSRSTEESLSKISQINIVLTKRELEEWEDLTV